MYTPTEESSRYNLDPERFQHAVNQSVDMLKKYLEQLPNAPVKAQVQPSSIAKKFSLTLQEEGQSLESLLATVQKNLTGALTYWQHPKFFAYYPSTTSIPAIVSELIIATFGSIGLQWSANPAATELECVVVDWLVDLMHAPANSSFRHTSRKGGGIIQNTAGEALAVVMVAARIQAHVSAQANHQAPMSIDELSYQDSSKLVAYMSDQSHFSGPKAVRVAGLRLHKIKAKRLPHGNYGITSHDVREAMEHDRKQGLTPCVVQLNFGSTNTCGKDDFSSFLGFAEHEKVWVHVDAAYAGAALILPEHKETSLMIQNIATSFNFNGSKWFLCGFDSAFLFVRDRNLLKQVFAADGDYLASVQEEDIYNPELKDWSIPLGRRFRALRIWMVLSYFGRASLKAFLRRGIAHADFARSFIDSSKTLEQIVTTDLGLVCFRLKTNDQKKNALFLKEVEACSENGKNFLVYPSICEGENFLRLALGGIATKHEDVEEFMNLCTRIAQKIV